MSTDVRSTVGSSTLTPRRAPHRGHRPAGLLAVAAALAAQLACSSTGRVPQRRPEAGATPPTASEVTDLLDHATVQPWFFDPSAGQSVEVSYTLSRPARVTVSIYGPNHELVAQPVAGAEREAGSHQETWDGLDADGAVVADEAYYPVVEARSSTGVQVYDPAASSGGERINPRDIHFDPREGLISYVLPEPSRVLLRAGIDEGPLLATVVNWEPRGAGLSTEHWSGRDQQGLRSFSREPDALVIVQAYALPEHSVIAIGNRQTTYRERYLAWGSERPRRPLPTRGPAAEAIESPHWRQPVHLDKDPRISVTFPDREDGSGYDPTRSVQVSGDRALVRVDVPNQVTKRFLRDQRFELVAFVDDQRVDEAEQAHLPFNWSWNLSDLEPGEHWLTINLVTFSQLVGTTTRRVTVLPPADQDAAAEPER